MGTEKDVLQEAYHTHSQQLAELKNLVLQYIEVDDDLMLKTCNMNDYRYTVITENDIVIPPLKHDDFI